MGDETTDSSGSEEQFSFDECSAECNTLKAQAMTIESELTTDIEECGDSASGSVLEGPAGAVVTFEQCLRDVQTKQEEAARLHEEAAACFRACLEQASNIKKLHTKTEELDDRIDDVEGDVEGVEADVDEIFDQVEEVRGQSEANDDEIMNRLEELERRMDDLEKKDDDEQDD